MKNKKILWKRRIATGLCMALLAVTIVSPMSFAAESTSSDLSGENVSTTEHITNVDSNILPEDSNSSAISTESSISSEVSSQSDTDDADGTSISSAVHAEEAPQEILSLTFDTDEVKEPVLGDTVPDSFNVQPNDGNSLTDDSEVFLSWRVKQADGTWDYAKSTSETVQFEAGKEYRLRFDIQNLKAADGKTFPDNVPAVKVNDMDVSVVTDDNVTDSYYTKTDDITVSFAMYSKSFKIENITSEVPPAETPEKTFIVTKDTDGSEIGRYDTLQDTLGAISSDNKDKWNAYTIMVTRDYTEDDKAPAIPMNATVTVTSSPGNQFVITRANPGRAWSSKHFGVGGDSSLILKNIILDGNNAMGGVYSEGGVGTHTRATTIILDEGAVIRNCLGRGSDPYTPWSGGAIATLGNGKGVVTTIKEGARIENCKSSEGYDGGAVYVDEGTHLNLEGGIIEGCEAIGTKVTVGGSTRHSNGGAIMLHGTMNMTGGTISNNKTTASGGGIAVSDTGRLSITGGTIEGNNGAHGGGIFIQESTAETKIENVTFTGNQAKYGGGVYLHKNAGINVSNSTFANNFAIQGGAIYTGNYSYDDPADTAKYQSITLADSVTFTENTASKGLYNPPQNADAFANLGFAKTSVTATNLVPMDSLLTNYDINYIHGDPVNTSAKYQVTFKFISLTNDASGQPKPLPQEVLGLLPSPMTNLKKGDVVTYPILNLAAVPVSGGKWIFTGWKGGTGTTINGDVQEVGGWIFDKTADRLYYPTMGIYIDGERIDVPQDGPAGSNANLPEAFKNVEVTFGGVTRTFSSGTVGKSGFPLMIKFTNYPNSTFTEGVYPYEVKNIPEGYTYEMIAKDHIVDGGIKVDGTLGNIFISFTKTSTPSAVAKQVSFNVHTLVNGTNGFANKEMLEQMNPVLRAEDGREVKPVRIADNGFTFDFENVPAGEYTLIFTYPAGYRFALGKVGSDMFGDYSDTGTKVTVTAGNVVNNFYTRLEKDPDGPNPPAENTGNLTVTKTVSGSRGDQNKEFTFTVTLDKKDFSGQYGDMTFTNGVATFTLKHGQSKTATKLPAGTSYTVDESDNSGYTVTKTNATGKIQDSITAIAAFENYRGSSGGSGGSSGGNSGGNGGSSSHTPQAARVTLTATKTLDSLIPTGSGFTFFLDDANGQRLQMKNNQNGNITFDTLTFNKTGTYVYYLTEQTGSDKNINYDTASYKVTITVTCPYDYEASVSYEKNGQAYHSVPAFANTTKPSAPAPTQTPPVVTPSRPLDNVPKTMDSSNLSFWGILAAVSLLSLIALLVGNKTRKSQF